MRLLIQLSTSSGLPAVAMVQAVEQRHFDNLSLFGWFDSPSLPGKLRAFVRLRRHFRINPGHEHQLKAKIGNGVTQPFKLFV
jgi:hypothetical protein